MNDTERDLARQLAAHPRWRFMRGMVVTTMRTEDGLDVVDHVGKDGIAWFGDGDSCSYPYCTPDITAPATQGCLWAMLREVDQYAGIEQASHEPYPPQWAVGMHSASESPGEALARALLGAWKDLNDAR